MLTNVRIWKSFKSKISCPFKVLIIISSSLINDHPALQYNFSQWWFWWMNPLDVAVKNIPWWIKTRRLIYILQVPIVFWYFYAPNANESFFMMNDVKKWIWNNGGNWRLIFLFHFSYAFYFMLIIITSKCRRKQHSSRLKLINK